MGESSHHCDSRTTPYILVVTADPAQRGFIATCLENEAFAVSVAADVIGMDQCLATRAIDLLLLDMMLPNHDGPGLCRSLRNAGQNLPLILFSAKAGEADRVFGLDAGADDYLMQPVSGCELVARIRAVLRRCRIASRSLRASEQSPASFDVARRGSD